MATRSGKRCLFVCLGVTPSPAPRRGGEVRARQNWQALRDLGYEVTVVAAGHQQPDWPDMDPATFLDVPRQRVLLDLVRNGALLRRARARIRSLASGHRLVFCEHWPSLMCCPRELGPVYSCHDLESKLVPIRFARKGKKTTWKRWLYLRAIGLAERSMLRRASRVLCVSATEASQVHRLTGRPAAYLPIVTGDLRAGSRPDRPAPARAWLFGTSGATANKVILDQLQAGLLAQLRRGIRGLEFHQAGSIRTFEPRQKQWLHENVHVHGFVEDLSSAMRFGDFCLMPYPHDTGFRTKIPLLCAYGVIPVGYPITFACCPEMVDGVNCVMARSPDEWVARLSALVADDSARSALAEGALRTRERQFSQAALLARYADLLEAKEPRTPDGY